MWTPSSKYSFVKQEDSPIFKIIKLDPREEDKLLVTTQNKMANVSIFPGASPGISARKIDPDRRSVSFTEHMDIKPTFPSPPHRRHSTNSSNSAPSARSRSPIHKKRSLDGDKPPKSTKLTPPKPLPDWIIEKEARKERDRASQEKKETYRRQRFNRDNSLGYEGRHRHRHGHQSVRQQEYEDYFSGGDRSLSGV